MPGEIVTAPREPVYMCDICNGQTFEQARRKTELNIIRYGWALPSVHPEPDDAMGGHWTYTVGLLENFDHPELIITEVEYSVAGEILNAIGEGVRAGDGITQMAELGYGFRDVHQALFSTDLLNTWTDHYGRLPEPGQFWQVILPETNYSSCHAHTRTDLSDPTQFPGSRRPNRAQRRVLERDRRRHNKNQH